MLRPSFTSVVLLLLDALLGGCPSPPPAVQPARPVTVAGPTAPRLSIFRPPFQVTLEQDNRTVPIAAHEARIARRPFALVLIVRDPRQGILMNVSLSPQLYDLARHGENLEGDFAPGTGLAEEQVLRGRSLMVAGRNAHHYLLADLSSSSASARTNRYHEVKPIAGGGYRCRRWVDALEFVGDEARLRREPRATLDELDSDSLYLVFFLAEEGGEHKRRTDYLRLLFTPR